MVRAAPREKGRPMTSDISIGAETLHVDAPSRRDFLTIVTAATGAVGAAATIWPLIDQMNPDAATVAAGGPIDIDLGQLQPGQQVVALWSSRPVFVLNRPQGALDSLRAPAHLARLADPDSREPQQPSYAANWSRSLRPEFLVVVGICTHLGCIPKFFPKPDAVDPASNWPGGYFCPCHGSKYDLAGRVFSGVPAPYNLPVPPYNFPNDKTLRVGENPPGASFDFNSILQV
jgi:ubiquinol-cytochrome c reductase iron-sulfur subunit